eukprot:CAMPEP_0178643646 /NCGR_PEP_ID=MMETSP0698-20121128/17852_1 /TAXON_ID=265572 /ORGANISM="Extubocellulus spinifer, Strain CCMP396" /LENGTH=680 /DNA_ID=CAMNT_0020284549 /DNA_START=165 /DNA_END=2207 /DNA_ORIENTATION=+
MIGGGGSGGGGPPPAPPGPPGAAAAGTASGGGGAGTGIIPDSVQRAAELSLITDNRYGAQMLAQHAMMMTTMGNGGIGPAAAGGGSTQYSQMQQLHHHQQHHQSQQQQRQSQPPQYDAGYVLNPDGTPLLDHHYRPIPLQKLLQTRPLRSDVSTRPGPGNMKLTYMSGEVVTRTLNELFGFGGWCMEVRQTTREECKQDSKGRYMVHYTATVRITHVASGSYREDVGANDSIDKSLGSAVANAMKGAVTDAMKRAARHFGEKLGNSLYDSKFSLKHAPMTLKAALETYDLDRNRATFFEKDRTRLPGDDVGGGGVDAMVSTAAASTTGSTGAAGGAVSNAMIKREVTSTATAATAVAAARTRAAPHVAVPPAPAPAAAAQRGPFHGKHPGSIGGVGLGVVIGRTPGDGPLHGMGATSSARGGVGGRVSIGASQPQPQKNMPYTPAVHNQARQQQHHQQNGAGAGTGTCMKSNTAALAATTAASGGGTTYPSVTPGPATVVKQGAGVLVPTNPVQEQQQQHQAKSPYGPPSASQNLQRSGLFGPSQLGGSDDGQEGDGGAAAALTDVTQTANISGSVSGSINPSQRQQHQSHELARPSTSRGRPSGSVGLGGALSLSIQPPTGMQQQQQAGGGPMKRSMGQESGDPLANATKRAALDNSSGMSSDGSGGGLSLNPYATRNV